MADISRDIGIETLALSETLTVPNYHALSGTGAAETLALSETLTVPNYHALSSVLTREGPFDIWDDILAPGSLTGGLLLATPGWATDTLSPAAKWSAGLLDDASAYRYPGTDPYTAAEIHAARLS